jgi:hypothetical protein
MDTCICARIGKLLLQSFDVLAARLEIKRDNKRRERASMPQLRQLVATT